MDGRGFFMRPDYMRCCPPRYCPRYFGPCGTYGRCGRFYGAENNNNNVSAMAGYDNPDMSQPGGFYCPRGGWYGVPGWWYGERWRDMDYDDG